MVLQVQGGVLFAGNGSSAPGSCWCPPLSLLVSLQQERNLFLACPFCNWPSTSDLDCWEGGQTGITGAGASHQRYGAGFGLHLQVKATWPQRYSSVVPPAAGRSRSCPPPVVLFRLAWKSCHGAVGAQAVCLSAAASFSWCFPGCVPAWRGENLW